MVLITPESLEATLVRRGAEAGRLFGALDAVVVDELHAFIGTDRGRQLLSILNRIEIAAGPRRIDRIALSATLGDMALAAEALRPGGGGEVTIVESREGGAGLLLQVRGHERPRKDAATERAVAGADDPGGGEAAPPVPEAAPLVPGPVAAHLFETLRGKRGLLFAGSRRNAEVYADGLRALSLARDLPNEFFPHHGNLARPEREAVEARLKNDSRPTTAVTTSTLELGIDLGEVESVAQIGPGWSVASLRQRLGRSGRRPGRPAVLRVYVIEEEAGPTSHPAGRLRLDLVQAIAMVELLSERWCEPPRAGGLHLSVLTHQVLALVAQTGGLRPEAAWRTLCERGPFRDVDRGAFVRVLRALARPGAALVETAPDGTLMLGREGERLAASHEFFAVFHTEEAYRVLARGRPLGTLPVDASLRIGQTIIFGGRRWRVDAIDPRGRTIEVRETTAALPPRFEAEGGGVHDRVAARMRGTLAGQDVPAFLDAGARGLLAQGREAFLALRLDGTSIVEVGRNLVLLPWVGSAKLETLALALALRGLQARPVRHAVEVEDCGMPALRDVLAGIAASPPPSGTTLAAKTAVAARGKYDIYLTRDLLDEALAAERLEPECLPALAWAILGGSRSTLAQPSRC